MSITIYLKEGRERIQNIRGVFLTDSGDLVITLQNNKDKILSKSQFKSFYVI